MIQCVTFGCDRLLTPTEMLYGDKCLKHSGDTRDAVVNLNKYEALCKHLIVVADRLEKHANTLRKSKYAKSPAVVKEREALIAVCDDACALILKLLNI